jgi:hypothetical protein
MNQDTLTAQAPITRTEWLLQLLGTVAIVYLGILLLGT